MGVRLLGLCHIATNARNRETKGHENLLTETEIKALGVLRQQFTATSRLSSARELSQALGYRSSRSGHLLLHRLLTKGALIKRAGHVMLTE
jgi:hypothetical protein